METTTAEQGREEDSMKVPVFGVVNIDEVNQSRAMDMEEIVKSCVDKANITPTFNVGHNRPSAMLITTETGLSCDNVDRLIRIGGICKHLMEEHKGYLEGHLGLMLTPFQIGVGEHMDEGILKDALEEIDYVWYSGVHDTIIVRPNNDDNEWLFVHTD